MPNLLHAGQGIFTEGSRIATLVPLIGLATEGVGNISSVVRATDGSFDILSTFRPNRGSGKLFREITLKEGTILERAFEEGKTFPTGRFLTRGNTAVMIESTDDAVSVLHLGETSGSRPTDMALFRINKDIPAKIGYLGGSSKPRTIQILISKDDLEYLEFISRRRLQ